MVNKYSKIENSSAGLCGKPCCVKGDAVEPISVLCALLCDTLRRVKRCVAWSTAPCQTL